MSYHKKALDIRIEAYGENHLETAESYKFIAKLH